MKKLYIFIILFAALGSSIQAQSTKRAEKLFSQKRYVAAAKAYEKAIKKGERSLETYTNIADSYYNLRDYKNAKKYYTRAVKMDEATAETMYRYAMTQKATGDYEGSNRTMADFASKAPADSRAKMYNQNRGYVKQIMGMEPGYTVENVEINSDASDFAAVRTNGKIYFSSSRNENRRKDGRKQRYLDIYEVPATDGDTIGSAQLLKGDVNTKWHEGTLDVTSDGKYMFFTRVDYYEGDYEKAEDGESKLNIYRAVLAGGEWRDIQKTSLNSDAYGVGHPSITADGASIYYASDAPDGMGGTDIYKADLVDGKISNPMNLGAPVNTPGNDSFPFMAKDGTLYFTSDGHLGLGGQDVFMYKEGKVSNLGQPINSPLDDFAFTIDTDKGKGYVSSNREGGKGGDDIYRTVVIDICEVEVSVMVTDEETGAAVSNAIISVAGKSQNDLPSQNADGTGKATFMVDCDQKINIAASLDGYENGGMEYTVGKDGMASVKITMKKEPEIIKDKVVLNKIFFDFGKSNIRPDAALELDRLVNLMKKNEDLEIMAETYADSRGKADYNLMLTEKRAQSIIDYIESQGIDASRLSAAGRGEENPVVDCAQKECTDEDYQASRRSEFTVVKE